MFRLLGGPLTHPTGHSKTPGAYSHPVPPFSFNQYPEKRQNGAHRVNATPVSLGNILPRKKNARKGVLLTLCIVLTSLFLLSTFPAERSFVFKTLARPAAQNL
jgi:hypothetical protein